MRATRRHSVSNGEASLYGTVLVVRSGEKSPPCLNPSEANRSGCQLPVMWGPGSWKEMTTAERVKCTSYYFNITCCCSEQSLCQVLSQLVNALGPCLSFILSPERHWQGNDTLRKPDYLRQFIVLIPLTRPVCATVAQSKKSESE